MGRRCRPCSAPSHRAELLERVQGLGFIHAAAVGEGEYGGIHDGDEDDVISALLALVEA